MGRTVHPTSGDRERATYTPRTGGRHRAHVQAPEIPISTIDSSHDLQRGRQREAITTHRASDGRRAFVPTVTTSLVIIVAWFGTSLPAQPAGAAGSGSEQGGDSGGSIRSGLPDIVLILSDDQRWDTLWSMPNVESEIVSRGVTFSNGFVVNASCCPSRATILTGQYSHTTGVYTNRSRKPYGGFDAFRDGSTIATALRSAGYRTGLFGKYLNGYNDTYVPPGWDRWFASNGGDQYYEYEANRDGVSHTFGSDPADYSTDVFGRAAVNFIEQTDPSTPLFLYFSPHAPHGPAVPAPGDDTAFSALDPSRPPSYNERDVADKPWYVRRQPRIDPQRKAGIDAFRQDQYETLIDLDRQVGAIVAALDATNRLSNTLLVYASDNGLLWGEHRLTGKGVPYEESIRVPFAVRYDRWINQPSIDEHLVLNLDLAPTFADAAGIDLPQAEGRSLLPLLSGTSRRWRNRFLVEHLNLGVGGVPTYCAVRSERYAWIEYGNGEEELYDLRRDPFELTNRAVRPRYRTARRHLSRALRRLCRPPPPGYTV
ncbi:MAG: sulfatase [Actinomycetota bacterium]